MPRAPQTCPQHGCPNTKPCPEHTPKAWSGKQPHHSRGFPKHVRLQILRRDNWTCVDCGHRDPTGRTLQADHIVNRAAGGNDSPTNGATRCKPCHHTKSAAEASAARWGTPRTRPDQ